MVRLRYILTAAAALSILCSNAYMPAGNIGAERPAALNDTLPDTADSSALNDSIPAEGSSFSREVRQFIYASIRVNPSNDSLDVRQVVDESKLYSPYNGKTIDSIIIERNNIFQNGTSFLERLANNLNSLTWESAIRRDLLFREGDKVDADRLVRNLFLLRSRSYIGAAGIDLVTYDADTNSVELTLRTYDNWTISVDASMGWDKNSSITIFDESFLGSGNKLSVITNFNLEESSYGGNTFLLQSPNVLGTFLSSSIMIGKAFDYSYLNLDISKEFINPTDYGGGILLSKQSAPYDILQFSDSVYRVTSQGYDVWAGVSRQADKLGGNIYLTARYFNWKYGRRPEVNADLNPAFHDTKGFLSGFGIYKEKYFTANRVFGYGIKEFLPAGYKIEGNVGYATGEFRDTWYLGAEYKAGRFFKSGYYLMGSLAVGGHLSTEDGQWLQSVMNAKVLWFSRMFKIRSSGIRQFVTLNYTRGWGRLQGNNEMVRFTAGTQPRGFTEHVTGLNRAVANLETVLFTPWAPLGFRTVLFGYTDAGLIGDDMNIFANDLYATFGIGARFKNEHLIFQAIQVRLGVAFCKNGYINSKIFELSNRRALDRVSYRPTKPEYVSYR